MQYTNRYRESSPQMGHHITVQIWVAINLTLKNFIICFVGQLFCKHEVKIFGRLKFYIFYELSPLMMMAQSVIQSYR